MPRAFLTDIFILTEGIKYFLLKWMQRTLLVIMYW